MFVVFDVFKSRTDEFFTLANLWHTRQIYARGDHWYDTGYDVIGHEKLPDDKRLLVLFPPHPLPARGRRTAEASLPGRADDPPGRPASHFEQTQTEGFVTVLVPHGEGRRTRRRWPRG